MHACFVSREYPPNLMGGIGTYVVNMTRILAEAGHTVSVLTQWHPDAAGRGMDAPVTACEGRLRVYYLPFVDLEWRLLPEAWTPAIEGLMRRDTVAGFGLVVTAALENLLLREPVDVIEAPEYEAPLLHFQQCRAALPPGHPWHEVPCVVHLHSPSHMIFEHNDDPLTGRWVRARKAHEALSITLADGVLSPSAFLAGQVREWLALPEERVHVLPYPIGPLLDCPPDCEPEPGLCLFVGRVEPRKGVFEFVEAAVRAARRHPHARFRFVGGPHHRDGKSGGHETAALLQSLIPGPLLDRFDFAGRVPRDTLGAEYRRAAFTAVPSRWDNYPNTCMEAMSCGRPVLASDQGGMAEMLEDGVTGIIAQGGGAPATARRTLADNLAAALDRMLVLDAEALAAMGKAARERILTICDDAAIIAAHVEWYRQLKRTNAAPAAPLRTGVVLLGDGDCAARAPKALDAVNAQDTELVARILVGCGIAGDHLAASRLDGWQVLADDAEGIAQGLDSLPVRLAAALEAAHVDAIYAGAADDVLAPGALRQAANYFANHPEIGCLTCWTRDWEQITTALRVEPAHLLAPAQFPERWFFRMDALAQCGGLLVNGSHLPDLLRDAVLRLLATGWRIGCLAAPIVQPGLGSNAPLLRPFAFQERRDSIRDVTLANLHSFHLDPLTLAEALTEWSA